MNKNRSIVEEVNSLQNAGKVLSITLNIQESFYNQGKLGKAFFHLSARKGFKSSRKGFINPFPNLGKLLKILGKVSFQIFPKLPWERKGKGKLSVLPKLTYRISANSFRGNYSFFTLILCSVTFGHSTYRCGNYSREETIQRRKLFAEIRQLKKRHL